MPYQNNNAMSAGIDVAGNSTSAFVIPSGFAGNTVYVESLSKIISEAKTAYNR